MPTEFLWLIGRIRPLLHWHLATFLAITAGSLLALLLPLLLKWLIDSIIPQKRIGLLLFAVVLIFLGHEAQVVLTSLGNYLMLTASQKMSVSLRVGLLKHIDTQSPDYFEQTPVGSVMYPFKEPIEEIAGFGSDLIPTLLRMLLTAAFSLVAMSAMSLVLTVTVLPLIPLFVFLRQCSRRKLALYADAVQGKRLVWNNFLGEHLSSVIAIQLLGQQERQERRALLLLGRTAQSEQIFYKVATRLTSYTSVAVALAMCLVIGHGGLSVINGTLSAGSLVAFYGFITQLFDPLGSAVDAYSRAQKVFASVRQVQSAFALQATVRNDGVQVVTREHLPEIEFSAVKFGYGQGKEQLNIPFLQIRAGESLAIAGENGAGKSTLAKLAGRLYDPASGSIRIGGEDMRNIDLKSLRQIICYISHEPALFDDTIESNLRFLWPRASASELKLAIECVGLSHLVAALPEGLGHQIGPRGCSLSGGERQRLALARALIQKPSVLILDEATSCLDSQGEAMILQELRRNLATSTLIVISHRPSTLCMFGRILVLAQGRIAQDSRNTSFRMEESFSLQQLFPQTEPQ